MATPGEAFGKSAVRCAACVVPVLVFRVGRIPRADAAVLLGLPLAAAVVVSARGLADARGDAVVVGGAAVRAGPVLPQVRVAALLRATLVGLRVLEANREVNDETGGPCAAGPPVGAPLSAVFPKGRRDRLLLVATCSRSHLWQTG